MKELIYQYIIFVIHVFQLRMQQINVDTGAFFWRETESAFHCVATLHCFD